MKYLLLLIVLLSFLDARIYRVSTREVVIDDSSKLLWQDDISVINTLKDHDVAETYCENLQYIGQSNWRLPKIEEFELIVDKKNTKNYINKAFKYNVPDGYWASKAHWRTLWFYADYMHFISGTAYYDSRHKEKYIRCVRNY